MVTFTTSETGEELAVMPRAEYERLSDIVAVGAAQDDLAAGREELLTLEEVRALLAGPTPLRFWRKKRDLTQQKLAGMLGLAQGFLSEVENGTRTGTTGLYWNLARILKVRLDEIVPPARAVEPGLSADDEADEARPTSPVVPSGRTRRKLPL